MMVIMLSTVVMMTMAGLRNHKKQLVKAWKMQKLGELCGEQDYYDHDHNNIDENYNDDENGMVTRWVTNIVMIMMMMTIVVDENRDDDETIQIEIPI